MTAEMDETITVVYSKADWNSTLNEIGDFDWYHTFDYHQLSKSNDETPILITYKQDDIIIALPLLLRAIPGTKYKDATSVYGYAGPVSKNLPLNFDNTIFKENLSTFFLKNNYVSVFSRLNPFILGQNLILNGLGNLTNQGKVVNINIQEDLDLQRQKFQSRLKTHINKARRCCTVKVANTEADWRSFMEIYYENMDRVQAKPFYYFNESYFKNIIDSENFESIVLIAVDNETGQDIAASLFVLTNGIVQYHLSGTKNQFLNLMPTKLLIDEMRIIATQRGYKFFNLGGGLGGSTEDSLFRFKASFSKDLKDFNLWKYIVNEAIYHDLTIKQGLIAETQYFPKYRAANDFNHV